MGNSDSKIPAAFELRALLEEAAAPLGGVTQTDGVVGQQQGHLKEAALGSCAEGQLKKLLESNLSVDEIAGILGPRETVLQLATDHPQALLCLLDQLVALVSTAADEASQAPIRPEQTSTLLSALRFLSLLLPMLLENRLLEQLLFWTPHPRCPRACSNSPRSSDTQGIQNSIFKNKQEQQQESQEHVSEKSDAESRSGCGSSGALEAPAVCVVSAESRDQSTESVEEKGEELGRRNEAIASAHSGELDTVRGGEAFAVERGSEQQQTVKADVVGDSSQAVGAEVSASSKSSTAEDATAASPDLRGPAGDSAAAAVSTAGANSHVTTTLGNDIINQLFRLLFLPGFTVTAAPGLREYNRKLAAALKDKETAAGDFMAHLPRHKLDVNLLWRGEIGASELYIPGSSSLPASMARNRIEVMHCLLACFAGPLYSTLDEYQLHVPLWIRVAAAGNAPYTANLFCSLLATACAADATSSGGVLGLFSSPELQQMSAAALQLLIVLLDFNVTVFLNSDGTPLVEQEKGPRGRKSRTAGERGQNMSLRNVFRSMVVGLRREEEFDFVYNGISRQLELAASRCGKGGSRAAALASCAKPDLFCEQLLILTWQLLTLNDSFLRHICRKRGAHVLLYPLVCLLLDASHFMHHRQPQVELKGREHSASSQSRSSGVQNGAAGDGKVVFEPGKDGEEHPTVGEATSALSMIGLLHMSSFILLVLSSEREFAVGLNEPFTGRRTPTDLPVFHGSYADLLCLTVHRVIMDATGQRGSSDSLVDMLLTVLCNVSAYVKSFCLESCLRLMSLMERLSRRQWLLSAPQHYQDVCFLLDVFNNVIQYQYEGNRQLVYSILRQKKLFVNLQEITLDSQYGSGDNDGMKDKRNSDGTPLAASEDHSWPVSQSYTEEMEKLSGKIEGSIDVDAYAKESETISTDNGGGHHDRKEKNRVTSGAPVKDDAQAEREQTRDESSNGCTNARASGGMLGVDTVVSVNEEDEEPWKPTRQWLDEWKTRLPLQTILRLIGCLLPQVEAEVARREVTDQNDILQFLEKTTMVGLLPVPHPIIIRNYQPNVYTALWFTSYMWGVLLAACPALQAISWRDIRLIAVQP